MGGRVEAESRDRWILGRAADCVPIHAPCPTLSLMSGAGGMEATADSAVAAWARTALATLSAMPGVCRVGIALVEGGGRRLRFTASDRQASPAGDVTWCHVDAYDDVPLNTAIRTGGPVLGTLDQLAVSFETFVERQRTTSTVALAAVPVVSAGQTLGGAVLFFDLPQPFDPEQRLTLDEAGERLGTGLRRAQRARTRARAKLADEPAPPTALLAVHEVAQDHAAVSGARRFLAATLETWAVDAETADAAVLCLSEVVTNALIHTDDGCSVRVLLEDGVLTVAVRDGGPAQSRSVELPDDLMRVHGRGLQIVDALTDRWGSELDTVGTTVWFTFDARPLS